MYAMRVLTSKHWPSLDLLIQARQKLQLDCGHVLSGEAAALVDVARLMPDPGMLPVGLWDDDALVAAFALERAVPVMPGWTEQEHTEPSLLVSHAHAHPEHERLFRLITPWLCDYAARLDDPPDWVRCTVRTPEIAEYLHEACGWHLIRTHRGWDRPRYLLQCAPQRSAIGSLIHSGDLLAAECAKGGTV
nr:hypothetical protein OG409_00480 [Streptomyces sp. NBC_00974]WSX54269.1 hypothetical protein OG409_38435 [Streptomyces sp. NBC_00974]